MFNLFKCSNCDRIKEKAWKLNHKVLFNDFHAKRYEELEEKAHLNHITVIPVNVTKMFILIIWKRKSIFIKKEMKSFLKKIEEYKSYTESPTESKDFMKIIEIKNREILEWQQTCKNCSDTNNKLLAEIMNYRYKSLK